MNTNIRSVENQAELERVFDLVDRASPEMSRDQISTRVLNQPNFEFWQTRIALDDRDEIVASVQVYDKNIWLNGREVKVAGLGNLSVAPEVQDKFDKAELIKDTMDLLREFNYPLSMVFSSEGEFYTQLGYFVMPAIEFSFEKFEAFDTHGVRRFEQEKDLERVMEIYRSFNSQRNGPVVRTKADWERQLESGVDDAEAFWVFERDGELNAYIRAKLDRGLLDILEFGGWKSYAAYFRRIMNIMFEELNFYTAKICLRREEPFFNAAYIPARQKQDTRMKWAVLDEKKLAEILEISELGGVDAFLKQLRDFQITFWYTDAF